MKLAKEPAHLQGVGEAVELGERLDVGDVDTRPMRALNVGGNLSDAAPHQSSARRVTTY